MFSKQEAAQLRREFWTIFGQYLKPIPTSEGEKVNWLNYKTGEKDVLFKMDTSDNRAIISIDLTHSDLGLQELYFEQFKQLKKIFEMSVGEKWNWKLHMKDENDKTTSRIFKQLDGVNIFKRTDWPTIISFFKPRIIALDEFWSNAKYAFEMLR